MGANEEMSKKRSGANLPSPLETRVFFIDRCLGRRIIPGALRDAGEEIKVHDDIFAQNAKDQDWLAEVSKRGWVVLTKDKNIRRRALEIHALTTARVRAFVLAGRGDLSGEEIGNIFVKALPAMKKLCATVTPPFIAHVSKDSSVALVQPKGARQ